MAANNELKTLCEDCHENISELKSIDKTIDILKPYLSKSGQIGDDARFCLKRLIRKKEQLRILKEIENKERNGENVLSLLKEFHKTLESLHENKL